ncbi:MAG: hypothetical protein ACK4UP_12110 [Spirosomataceae bacterium]
MTLPNPLKRRYFIASLLLFIQLVGCKREMAVFTYHPEAYQTTKQTPKERVSPTQQVEEVKRVEEQPLASTVQPESINKHPVTSIDKPIETKQDFPFLKKKKKQTTRQEAKKKPFSVFQKKESQEKKKRIMNNTFLNDQVKIGGLFLGGAILLSLIDLPSLALLFGIASLLLLFLGFKKYFRRQRRKRAFRLKNK